MKIIDIEGKSFEYFDGNCQLSIGSHATMYYSFDLTKYPNYKDIFIERYNNRKRFDIKSNKYIAFNNIIKYIDLDLTNNTLGITTRCDVLEIIPMDERRAVILEELLK